MTLERLMILQQKLKQLGDPYQHAARMDDKKYRTEQDITKLVVDYQSAIRIANELMRVLYNSNKELLNQKVKP